MVRIRDNGPAALPAVLPHLILRRAVPVHLRGPGRQGEFPERLLRARHAQNALEKIVHDWSANAPAPAHDGRHTIE